MGKILRRFSNVGPRRSRQKKSLLQSNKKAVSPRGQSQGRWRTGGRRKADIFPSPLYPSPLPFFGHKGFLFPYPTTRRRRKRKSGLAEIQIHHCSFPFFPLRNCPRGLRQSSYTVGTGGRWQYVRHYNAFCPKAYSRSTEGDAKKACNHFRARRGGLRYPVFNIICVWKIF